jgi:hypothetical protein
VTFLAHKSVVAILIAAVLAIGGCLPCQKLFAGETTKKSCCNSKGECQRPSPDTPAKKACNLQVADAQSEPQQKADRLVDGGLPLAGEISVAVTPVSYTGAHDAHTGTFDSSPPPLFLLNLSLLI